MAVSMRLMRFGGKKNPFYRIVVSDRRTPRDGRFIDQVGTYDPKKDPVEVQFKEEKAIDWLRKGAQPTPTVRQLLIRSGLLKNGALRGAGQRFGKRQSIQFSLTPTSLKGLIVLKVDGRLVWAELPFSATELPSLL